MKLKNSYFNTTVFRRNTTGYWPVWAAYLAVLIIAIPIAIYSGYAHAGPSDLDMAGHNLFYLTIQVTSIAGFIFAILAAMAIYSFMYNSRSTMMMAGLPVKREAMFTTSFLTGVIWIVGVHIITAIITILVQLTFGFVTIVPLLQGLAVSFMVCLFFFGFASMCAALTGNILTLPAIYLIFNFIALAIHSLANNFLELFLYGYASGVSPLTTWLTPIMNIMKHRNSNRYYEFVADHTIRYTGWQTCAVYAVCGIILFAIGMLIYRRRKMEYATDVVAVDFLKPISRYLSAFCSSMALGTLLYALFTNSSAPYSNASFVGFAICFFIGGLIGYFASEMLIQKSFKVFHKWKGFAVYSVITIALLGLICADVSGFETRIPDLDEIKSATITVRGEELTTSDPDELQLIQELHQLALDNKGTTDWTLASAEIEYNLDSNRNVKRYYEYAFPIETLSLLFDLPARRLERVTIPTPQLLNADYITGAIEFNINYTTYSYTLTESQFLTLYQDCILPDVVDSSIGNLYDSIYGYVIDPSTVYEIDELPATMDGIINVCSSISVWSYLSRSTGDTDDFTNHFIAIPLDAQRTMAFIEGLDASLVKY